jgi:hypothetical protein
MGFMIREQVKRSLDRVRTWPPKRQEDTVKLSGMERENSSPYHLADEQVQKVQLRHTDFAPGRERYATNEEVAAF